MKLLMVLTCACVLTHGSPIDDNITTTIPSNETTQPNTSGSTANLTTIVPMTSESSQASMTTMSPITITIETVTPGSETTENPVSGETAMSPSSSQGTTQSGPPTVSPHTIKTPTTKMPPTTAAPQKGGGFDGGSFGGGIALGAAVALIIYIAYRIYASKKTAGYSTM